MQLNSRHLTGPCSLVPQRDIADTGYRRHSHLKGAFEMHAEVGDELIIEGHRVGEPRRTGKVQEVRGNNGGPPYRVLWDDWFDQQIPAHARLPGK